ncbi:MAG: PAS domain S-box protein, partial [Thermodesulfobacteriota bacterium]|nr:PAS domain S-box protein [Thermodesulfobacteriota bacterium]
MKKILVVDNDRLMLDSINDLLSGENHQVVTAGSGLSALDALKTYTPDIIIVDLVMPNIDGRKLCKVIRGMERLRHVHLVVLSATAAEDVNIIALGADDYIAKGPNMSQLVVDVIKRSDLPYSRGLQGEVLGVKQVGSRVITKELLSVRRHFEIILEKMSEGILEVTSEGRVVYANPASLSLIGVSEEELLGSHFIEVFEQDDRDRIVQLLRTMGGKPMAITEHFPLRLNEYQVKADIFPIGGEDSEHIIILDDVTEQKRSEEALKRSHSELEKKVAERTTEISRSNMLLKREIEDRKLAEEALRASEEKYRSIAERSFDMIFTTDNANRITYVSPAVEKIFHFKAEEVLGKHPEDFVSQTEMPQVSPPLAEEKKGGDVGILQIEAKRKDGKNAFVEVVSSPIFKDGERIGAQGIIRDVTRQKQEEKDKQDLEKRLARAQKMEALGLLAGGVAHDLNNILSGIASYPELLLMDLPEDSRLRRPLEVIQESGNRAAAVVSDLITIARGVTGSKRVLNLNQAVEEFLLSAEYRELEKRYGSVSFKTRLAPDLLNVSCSSVHLKTTLMNLVTNASEAIEGKGNIVISTKNQYVDKPLKTYEEVCIGEYAVLTVSDDGPGIPQKDLERIFEPFYTKKIMGRSGTGLGLAVVWNTVQEHDGYVNVRTDEKGTTFEIYLPITRDEVDDLKKEIIFKDYSGSGENLLVIDDE